MGQSQIDESFSILEEYKREFKLKLNIGDENFIPLDRQSVLMRQDKTLFIDMVNDSLKYKEKNPSEYYASLKRFFEFLLNKYDLSNARIVFPALQKAYFTIQAELPLVSKISFVKLSGQFLILDGYPHKGEAILNTALVAAVRFQLHGQARQISNLIQSIYSGKPFLDTFHFK